LSAYFELVVVRPGAIYGKDRNIGHRILEGKPVPKGKQRVHRIHVHDLARLAYKAALSSDFPDVINAVDLESETTKKVADWLVAQPFFPSANAIAIRYREDFQTRKFNLSQPDRKISNHLLTKTLGFSFVFPTYKEGLTHVFTQKHTEQQT
jgi:nucleoside-diphosphate-sugar epimerase